MTDPHLWPETCRASLTESLTPPPTCNDCGSPIHSGDCCIECFRDWRELCAERDREWWS